MQSNTAKKPVVSSADADTEFTRDILCGLTAENKKLSPKYFYDARGSQFFDQICDLEEYYLYRTELRLLPLVARDLSRILTDEYAVVEFGAGSLLKIRPLLKWIRGIRQFIPIDISGEHLQTACAELAEEFPGLQVRPIAADFCNRVDLGETHGRRLGFFPGSTIGNFTPLEARRFLQSARQTLVSGNSGGGYLIVGVDTKKSPALLHRAYNDDRGVTAEFNLNILHRINRELDGNIDTDLFEHYAYYDPCEGCIKMQLVSLESQCCEVAGEQVSFAAGESIHTESSYKYHPDEFTRLAADAGWTVKQSWLAENNMFSMFLLYADSLQS